MSVTQVWMPIKTGKSLVFPWVYDCAIYVVESIREDEYIQRFFPKENEFPASSLATNRKQARNPKVFFHLLVWRSSISFQIRKWRRVSFQRQGASAFGMLVGSQALVHSKRCNSFCRRGCLATAAVVVWLLISEPLQVVFSCSDYQHFACFPIRKFNFDVGVKRSSAGGWLSSFIPCTPLPFLMSFQSIMWCLIHDHEVTLAYLHWGVTTTHIPTTCFLANVPRYSHNSPLTCWIHL